MATPIYASVVMSSGRAGGKYLCGQTANVSLSLSIFRRDLLMVVMALFAEWSVGQRRRKAPFAKWPNEY